MLTAQVLSFLVIIGMNLVATILVWAEYLSNRFNFLKQVAIGQSFALLWFLVGLWITFSSFSVLATTLSSITVFWAGLYFLAASMYQNAPARTWIIGTGAVYTLVLAIGSLTPLPAVELSWYLVFLLFLAMPLATVVCFKLRSRWLVAVLQLTIAILLIFSIILLGSVEYVDLGAFLYFIISILIPLLSISYIISSVRLSRLEIASKERDYRVFFDSVKEAFYRSDKNGTILAVSPSVDQFGVSGEQITGSNLADYLDDSQAFKNSMQDALNTMKPFEYRGSFTGGAGETDCEIVSTPIRNDIDCYFAGSIRNVHDRNLLEKQLIDTQRYESLGVMAGGVAHDFNNILQGIVGRAEILYDMDDDIPEERKRHLDAILSASASAGHLCRQLLMYTGRDIKDEKDFDLGETVREVIEILKTSHSRDIEIKLSLPDTPALMHGSKSQVGQIFLNLVKNAMEAVGDEGTISVTLERRHVDSGACAELGLSASFANKNYLLATVCDSGPGIEPNVQEEIFEPFYTTKAHGRGLGLAAISGILRAHSGGISLTSEPGEGASFTVALPSIEGGKMEAAKSTRDKPLSKKRILLAEDESGIREVASTMLSQAGHEVTLAEDGLQALQVFEQDVTAFDLLITDIRMPGMDGLTLARRLKDLVPTLPVILATGYADISDSLAAYESEGYQFIRKPFRAGDLLDSIEASFVGNAGNSAS